MNKMLRLKHILSILFLVVAKLAMAQNPYVIDSVCVEADRTYRIDGEKGSTYDWYIRDTAGTDIANPGYIDFFEVTAPGDTIWGSEIGNWWDVVGLFDIVTYHFSLHGCDTLEVGSVKVFEKPEVILGPDQPVCNLDDYVVTGDSAWNYSSLQWSSMGDGSFTDDTNLHPVYKLGPKDSIAGSVTLILTAFGLADNITCIPVEDSLMFWNSSPKISLSAADLLCYNDSSGWIGASVESGSEPYTFAWTGPGAFTSTQDSIFGLAAGVYTLAVTNSFGCTSTDSIEIFEPEELLANISTVGAEVCSLDTISLHGQAIGGTGAYTHLWTGNGAMYLDHTDSAKTIFDAAPPGDYTFIYTVSDENLCVAVDSFELNVLPLDTTITDTVICGMEAPFAWNGMDYYTSDTYTDTLVSATGCDSILMLNLTVLPIDTITFDTIICISDAPFAWYGKDYFSTDVYTDTLVPVFGCDTILVLDLTVMPIDTLWTDTVICALEAPFNWYGKDYYSSDIYLDTLPAPIGCDTIAVLDLTVLPLDTLVIDTVVCGMDVPFAINGQDYYTSDIYTDTIVSATGCDSILIVDLTVLPIDTLKLDTVICGIDAPLTWYGTDYYTSDIYTDTLVSATGCDSILQLDLTVLPIDTVFVDTVVCGMDVPFAMNGHDYYQSDIYTDTIVSGAGCDSILILNLTVLPIDTITFDTIICISDAPFAWYGKDYYSTDVYTDTLVPAFGCDTILVLDLTVMPIDTLWTDTVICALEAPFNWYGKDYYSSDIYLDTLPAPIGCDTIAVLDLTVLPLDTMVIDTVVCGMDVPFAINGQDYYTSDIYTDTIVSATGCDSILIVDLTVLPIDTLKLDTVICGIDAPLTWYGTDYYTSDIYTDTLVSATGCDSILQLDLTVLPIDTVFVDTVVCGMDVPFAMNGHDYYQSDIYTDTIVSGAGCDSILILNLTVLPIDTITFDTIICISDTPFAWYGKDYYSTDVYTDTLVPVFGCDTILVLDLTVMPIDTLWTDTVICALEAPFNWYGKDYYSSDIYLDTLPAPIGCDTIAVLDLTVLPLDTMVIDTVVCGMDVPFAINGQDYYSSDIYTDTIVSATGCDSILIVDLTVLPIDTLKLDTVICGIDAPLTWYGTDYYTSDIYTDTLVSATGCDSILQLDLTVLPIDTLWFDTTICANELPFVWNGINADVAGVYIDTISGAIGCDTISVLELFVDPLPEDSVELYVCANELPLMWHDSTYTNFGTYSNIVDNAMGCDSIIYLTIFEIPATSETFDTTLCAGDLPFMWHDSTYSAFGTYTNIITNTAGCDSIITFTILESPPVTGTYDTTLCAGELPFIWHDSTYTTFGTYTNVISTMEGCDSLITLTINPLPTALSNTDTLLCEGSPIFTWNGQTIFTDTDSVYSANFANASGCDSLSTLTVSISEITYSTTVDTIYNTDPPYSWNGKIYGATGIYYDTIPNVAGCDSAMILDLTILPNGSDTTIYVTICEPDVYVWGGVTYSSSGTYGGVYTNKFGGDSIVTLDLTVLATTSSTLDTTINENDAPFIWNGVPYSAAGTYTTTLTNAAGCDSVLTLNLSVIYNSASTLDTTICEPDVVVWNSNTYDTSGTYIDTLVNVAGGDSIDVLNLTVLQITYDTLDVTINDSDAPYVLNGVSYNTDGTYILSLINAAGCDSILTLNLTILPPIPSDFECPPDFNRQCHERIPAAYANLDEFRNAGGVADGSVIESSFNVSEDQTGMCPEIITRYYSVDYADGTTESCEQTITVIDTTPPVVYKVPDNLVEDCNVPEPYKNYREFYAAGGDIRDRCSRVSLTHLGDVVSRPGLIVRTYEFKDDCGNAVQWEQLISIDDRIPPVFTQVPDTFKVDCEPIAIVTWTEFVKFGGWATDNCALDTSSFALVSSVPDGITCPRNYINTYEIYDMSRNRADTVHVVVVIDNEKPILTCPQDITLGFKEEFPDAISSLDDFLSVGGMASDNCGIDSTSFTLISEESAMADCDSWITYTYRIADNCGNWSDECSFSLYRNDFVAPEISCMSDTVVECFSDVPAVFSSFTEFIAAGGSASDNIELDESSFIHVGDSLSGSTCPIEITRTYQIEDICGNAERCSYHITIQDVTPPVIVCPSDTSIECLSDVIHDITTLAEFEAAGGSISDNCEIDINSFEVTTETVYAQGRTKITNQFKVSDLCGNIDSCTQVITLTDTIPPVPVCNDITVQLDDEGNYVLSDIDIDYMTGGASDNCTAEEDLIIDIDVVEFTCEDVEEGKLVNVIVTDEAGNSSVCMVQVTVVDEMPPVAICQDITVSLDASGETSITAAMIDNGSFDNCGLESVGISRTKFDCTNVGENYVILRVTDAHGNQDVCQAIVTVVDEIPPVISCIERTTIQLGADATYALTWQMLTDSVSDECGIDTLMLSQDTLDCSDIGTTQITVTAYDINGNQSDCTVDLEVFGNIAPNVINDSAVTAMNIPVDIDVVSNDYDLKTSINLSTLGILIHPTHGKVTVDNETGMVSYTPDKDYIGPDVFRYTICDDAIPCQEMCGEGLVFVTVRSPNQPPVAVNDYFDVPCGNLFGNVLNNDSDPDEDPIEAVPIPETHPQNGVVTLYSNGNFEYEPFVDFAGVDSFQYIIRDAGVPPTLYDTAWVYVTRVADNDCDGVADVDDIDDDNDGIRDIMEGDRSIDSDRDGIPDSYDIDSDNDGILDNIEGQEEHNYIPPTGRDSNGNGWDDAYDNEDMGYPFDINLADTDGDTMPDFLDIDTDNDGVFDYIEGQDVNADGIADVIRMYSDTDFDGLDDAYDTYSGWAEFGNETGSNAPLQDFDSDGDRDWRDTNDENDEFETVVEDINGNGDYSDDDLDLDGHPEYLDVELDCELFIPEGFSPNNDGVHDFFQILCIYPRYPEAKLMIFNRNGQKIFEKENYGNYDVWGWEDAWWWGVSENRLTIGRSGGLPAGNYIYVLELGNGEVRNGTVMIAY